MSAPASVFDKALPALSRAASLPAAQTAARYVGEWLATLVAHPGLAHQFDAELDDYAGVLRRDGVLVGEQAAGFLLALWSRLNTGDPLQAELVRQVDRRAALSGRRWCVWRGSVPVAQFDAWQFDRARERAALKNKGER